jgi:hypothetical protein
MATYKKVIHDALVEAGLAGTFPPVVYEGRDMAVLEDRAVPPSAVLAWETSSRFGLPERHRMTRRQEKFDWQWQLGLEFSHEVVFEVFEEFLCVNQILIPRGDGLRQVTLELMGAEYENPPRQGAVKGSAAVYSFLARVSPA